MTHCGITLNVGGYISLAGKTLAIFGNSGNGEGGPSLVTCDNNGWKYVYPLTNITGRMCGYMNNAFHFSLIDVYLSTFSI